MTKEDKGTYFILLCLTALAAILRLYHPFEIPFTADEFNALSRTKFGTFSELIAKGVIIDGHPAGVQVFLYYWIKITGISELAIKLPFITCGVLSVLYIFLLGREWFNSTVGLICAAFIVVLQYSIMSSQIARPYASGLFFSLAMVYYWSKLVFKPETKFVRNNVLYVLFTSLCTYDHYFTLLFAGIVAISGLLFIKGKYIKPYLLAGLSIVLLYFPHIRIFLYQFKIGGLPQIIGPPHYDFILNYFKYVFNFSYYMYFLVLALLIFGLISTIKMKEKKLNKFMMLSFTWFTLQYLITFLYSVYVSPILEFSCLLFTFPFLLFCLFGWLPNLSFTPKLALISMVCCVGVLTLVFERRYYDRFYKSRVEQQVLLTDSVIKEYGRNNCLPFLQINDNDSIPQYYIKKHGLNVPYMDVEYVPGKYFKLLKLLDSAENKIAYMSYGGLSRSPAILMSIFLNYYPYVIKQVNFDQSSFFLLTSNAREGKSPYIFQSMNDFEKPCENWDKTDRAYLSDTCFFSGKYSYRMDSLHDWGPGFSSYLNRIIDNNHNLILISLSIYALGSLKDVDIVSTITSGDKSLYWSSTPVSNFIHDSDCRKWMKAYHSIKLPDIYLNYPDIKVSIYIWNRGRKNFFMDDFGVKTIEGNPLIYWQTEKV